MTFSDAGVLGILRVNENPETLQNAASDEGLHCLSVIRQFLDISR